MPNVPASQINLLDQRGGPASALLSFGNRRRENGRSRSIKSLQGSRIYYDPYQVSGRPANANRRSRNFMRNPISKARSLRAAKTPAPARPGRQWLLCALATLILAAPALAEHTRWWRQNHVRGI